MKMKKIASIVFAGCLSLMMTALPAKAAETVQYTVTIRPGSVARFSDTFLDQYRAIGATVTEKTGSIKVKVQAGGTIPYLPDAGDLVYQDGKEGRYTMNTDWYPDSLTVTENENLVVKYDALNDAVEYRVRYVDSQSGEDVATPMIAQGNVGDTYTYYSETISGYRCDIESQSLTLTSRAGDNELVFNRSSFQVTPSPEPKPFRETPPLSPEEGRQPEVAQQPERQVEQQLEPELEQLVQKPEQEQQPTMAQARTLPEIQQIKARQKPSTTTKHHSATSHRRTIRITIPKKSKPMKHQKEAAGQKKTMTLLPTSSPEELSY